MLSSRLFRSQAKELLLVFVLLLFYHASSYAEAVFPSSPESPIDEAKTQDEESAEIAVGGILSDLSGAIFLPVPVIEEEKRTHAERIWNEAAALQLEERFEDALEKYREGLLISEDPVVRDHVEKLERFLDRKREREAARERAVALWNEAAALQLEERYEEALLKYREGLELSADPVVEEHAVKLESFILRRRSNGSGKRTEP